VRVTFVGHACHLVEVDGLRVLTDPWLVDPIFEGHVEHDPPLGCSVADLPPLDAIALSHGHLDHFNAPTLAALPDKSIPVVHPPIRFTEVDANLARLGFTNLHARGDWEPFALGGEVRVVPTPSLGVLDECAWLIEGRGGRFWNGVDAPQPPSVAEAIAARFAPVDLCALSHNSFDQPALLGLPSLKEADHGPRGGAASARSLRAGHAFAASSNLRWCGPDGDAITRKVIRRRPRHLAAALASDAPDTKVLDLAPGDAWSREGGIERGVLSGPPSPRARHDYVHPFLGTGERFCGDGRPATDETFHVHLPARTATAPEASAWVGQRVLFEISGDDPGVFTVDFAAPGAAPEPGDAGAGYGVRLGDADWKDLFERRISWQVLLVSDRLAVTRFEPGPPPRGLNFCFALQALFP
jgi:L-ascorbate metabolism protein UlaG (beta-lactamase superfamily)